MQYNSLIEVMQYFSDEQVCKEHLEKLRWNGLVQCPHCNNVQKIYRTKSGFKCGNPKCYKKFTVLVGTFFENTKIKLSKWFVAIYLATSHKKGISSLQLAKDIKVSQKTAWFMLHRIREMLKEHAPHMLEGIVEVDETFIGGKSKNKHKEKLQKMAFYSKTPVFGMVQRGGYVRSEVIKSTTKKELTSAIKRNIKEDSVICSDNFSSYAGMSEYYKHYVINHGQGHYAYGDIHTNGIEGFWSLLKRGILGIYHQVSVKHLQKYCNEFNFRYNTKDMSEQLRFDTSISNCKGRLKYKELIAK